MELYGVARRRTGDLRFSSRKSRLWLVHDARLARSSSEARGSATLDYSDWANINRKFCFIQN